MPQMPKWIACPTCFEMVLYLNTHKCLDIILQNMDEHLDYVISEQLSTLDDDIDVFWHSNDVRFMQYLLNRDQNER